MGASCSYIGMLIKAREKRRNSDNNISPWSMYSLTKTPVCDFYDELIALVEGMELEVQKYACWGASSLLTGVDIRHKSTETLISAFFFFKKRPIILFSCAILRRWDIFDFVYPIT